MTNFRLSFFFIVTGIVCFAFFQMFMLTDFSAWLFDLSLDPREPTGWSRAHLFVLGWATMIAMGAVYQLVPVVLKNKPLFSAKLGYVHYFVFVIGLVGLVAGFQTMNVMMIGSFATIAFIGILLFATNIGITLGRANVWNQVTISCAVAIFHLVLTGAIGLLMGLNLAFDWWSMFHDQLLGAHLWLGAIGWFGFLITGFSYKLFPMFYLSHGHSERLQTWAIGLLFIGTWVGVISFLFNAPAWSHWIALSFTAAAFCTYAYHLVELFEARHKPSPGAGIRWSAYLAQGLAVIAVLLVLVSAFWPELVLSTRMAVLIGWLYLWGWVGLTVLAYLSKIAPFLWWTHKYGSRIGKEKTPTMADLIDDRSVHWLLLAMILCLFVVAVGFGWGASVVLSIGGSLLAVCSLLYIGLVASVFLK